MFNSFPIFKRVASNQLISKINIILFVIFFPLFVASIVYGMLTANLTIFGWVSFAILLLYVTFYNIFFVVSFYNKDLDLGVTNLEIRSGYKKGNIFFQRLIAQKAYILPMQIFFVLVWIGIGLFSGVPFIKMSTVQLIFGILTIFIYEILISAFLLLFSSFKSGIATTFFGVIFGILLGVMPLFSLLDAHTNSMIAATDEDYGKHKLQKYSVLDEFDSIRKRNKNGIIDSQVSIHLPKEGDIYASKTSHFYELFTYFDEFFRDDSVRGTGTTARKIENQKQRHFDNGRDFYEGTDYAEIISRSYANDLIYNGLVAEFLNPVLDIYSDGKEAKYNKFISDQNNSEAIENQKYLLENNEVLKFINEINIADQMFKSGKTEDYKNSFFTLNADSNKRFSGELGFDNFIRYLKKQWVSSKELVDILNLINETAKLSYTEAYTSTGTRSSIFDFGGSSLSGTGLTPNETNLWLTTDANAEEKKWLNISSDGARVFFKVYFDILREYFFNEAPTYNISNSSSESNIIDGHTYLKEVKKKTLFNPGILFTKLFYNAGNNRNFANSQADYFDPFVKYVYDFDNEISDDYKIDKYLNLNKDDKDSTLPDFVLWDSKKFEIPESTSSNANEKYFHDSLRETLLPKNITLADGSTFSRDELEFRYFANNNEFANDTTVPGTKSYISGFQVYSTNGKFYGEKNFSILFDVTLQPEQKKYVKSAIERDSIDIDKKIIYIDKSVKADIYKFGKNDGQLEYVGSTFNVWIPLATLVVAAAILLEISWLIFNKRIIK